LRRLPVRSELKRQLVDSDGEWLQAFFRAGSIAGVPRHFPFGLQLALRRISPTVSRHQLFEQRLSLLQIERIEPFREPAVTVPAAVMPGQTHG
jgi:hypothetical protein